MRQESGDGEQHEDSYHDVEEESGVPSGRSCEEEEEEDAKGRRDKNKKKKSKTKKKKKSKEKVKERPKKDQVASKAKVEKQQQKSEGNSKRRRQGEGGSFEVADGLPQQDQIHVVSETQKDSDEELWEYYAQCGQTTFLWPPVLTEAMAVKKAEAEAQESGTAMELVVADEQEEDGVPPLPPAPSPSPEEAADEEDEEEAQADEQEEAVEEAASPEVVSEADQGGDSPPEEEKETGEADGDDQQQPEGPDVSPPEEHPSPEAVPELPVESQHHQAAPALAACPGTMEQESEATDVVDSDNVEEDLGDAGEESLQEEDEEVPQDNEVAEDESTDEHKHRPKCKKSKGSKDAKKRKSRRSRGREKVASKAKTLKKEKGTKKRQHEKAKKSAHVKKVKHKKKKRKSVSSGTASEGDLDDAGAHTEESSAQLNEDDDDKDEDNSDAKDEDNSDAQESSAVQHSGECSGSESPAASTTTLKKKKKQGKSSTKHKVQGQEETSRSRRRSNDKPVADRKLTAAKSMPAKRAYQTGKESEKMLGPEALRKLICGVYARKNPSKLGDLQDLWEKYKGSELEVYHHVCKKYGEVPFAHMASEPEAAIVQVRPVENIFELARLAAGAEEGDHSDMDLKDEDRGIDGWPFVDEEYQANNTDSDSDFELYHPAKQSIAGASAARNVNILSEQVESSQPAPLRPVATSASDLLLVPEPEQSKSRRCAVAIEDPTKLFAGSKALRALELEFEEELEKKLHNLEAVESPLIPESESDIVLSEEEGEDGDIEPSDRIVPDPLGTSGNNNEVPAETASLSSRALTERFLALVGQQVGETPVGPPEPKQAPKPCPSLCASTAMSAALLGAPWRAKPPAKAPPSGSAPPRPSQAQKRPAPLQSKGMGAPPPLLKATSRAQK